jgi:membrane-associated two-gene conflict system component 1 (EACC1)
LDKDKTDLIIRINPGSDNDEEELARTTQQLREELSDLNIDSVDTVKTGPAPEGSKAGEEMITWGSLLVSLAASGGVLPSLIGTVQSWLSRRENQKISMEIDGDKLEVTGVSSEEQRRLIDIWVGRHSNKL